MDKKLMISYELKELIINDSGVTIETRVLDSVAGEYNREKGQIIIDSIVKIDREI